MIPATGTMAGKVCLVTGTTSGIGKAVALGLARMGATVVMAARDPVRGEAAMAEIKAASGNERVELLLADLASLRQVRRLAQQFTASHRQLHVLINNAGTMFPASATTEDGFDTTFAVNHLAPFLLTNLLLDTLKASAPARIVNITSVAHYGTIDFTTLQRGARWRGPFPGWQAYRQSKLASILLTYELARRLDGTGVTANCVHPGMVDTNVGMESQGFIARLINRYRPAVVRWLFTLPWSFLLTPEEGARSSLFLASSPEVEGVSGRYFVKTVQARSSRRSLDPALAQRLWRADAELVGLDGR